MILLLPITKIAALLAGIYAFFALMIYALLASNGVKLPITIALSFAGAIDIFLVLFLTFGWRFLWREFPKLNDLIFPDFSGTWDAQISWVRGTKEGVAHGKVVIRQDFFRISIEMDAPDSESSTLALCAIKNPVSHRPELNYIYEIRRKRPKPNEVGIYRGAAILRSGETPCQLAGHYFTSQASSGRFEFSRIDS